MDQPGPRHIALKPFLIERPDLESPRQWALSGGVTIVFWAFWFYLWLPVIALLGWLLGIQQAYKYMIALEGLNDVLRLIGIYGLIILLLGGGLILWALYNIARFGGVEHRKASPPATLSEMGRDFGQDPAAVARWQGKRRLYVSHDENGRIVGVDILDDGAQLPA